MTMLISGITILILSFATVSIFRKKKNIYFYLLWFVVFVGGILGNFLLEYLQHYIRNILHINFLGTVVGSFLFFLIFNNFLKYK